MKKNIGIVICVVTLIIIALGWYVLSNQESDHNNMSTEVELTIMMNKTSYNSTEPINITITLKNIGTETINVSEMRLELSTLHFELNTPNESILHYAGNWWNSPPKSIILEPNHSIQLTLDIRKINFGDIDLFEVKDPTTIELYDFNQTGEHKIQAIYKSMPTEGDIDWKGTIYSNTITFTITSE